MTSSGGKRRRLSQRQLMQAFFPERFAEHTAGDVTSLPAKQRAQKCAWDIAIPAFFIGVVIGLLIGLAA